MDKLYEELKRRKVFRVVVVYAVVAWVLIQVADTIAPMMNLPESVSRLVLFLLITFSPIALFLSWAYEVSREGSNAATADQSVLNAGNSTDRRLNYAILVLVLLVAEFQITDRFMLQQEINSLTVGEAQNTSNSGASKLLRRTAINLGMTVPTAGGLLNAEVALSPDSKRLVIGVQRPGTPQQIYVRELGQLQAKLISGSDGGDHPFFSPDSEWVAYTASDNLIRISIRGGTSLPVADFK